MPAGGVDYPAERACLSALPRSALRLPRCSPLSCHAAVWDQLFFEGSPAVLFRVALALVEIYDQVRECQGKRRALAECGGLHR